MAITDELREFARSCAGGMGGDALRHIADRIDREHRMAMEKVAAEADALPMTDESMAENGWIRLPVDADGVPIRIGDVMEMDGESFEVRRIEIDESGEWTMRDRMGVGHLYAHLYRHHHAPTVEDVLREFAEKITDSQIPGVHPTYEEAIAEYAAKLRLAGDE